MNPSFADTVVKEKIFHKKYNLDQKDNLDELPEEPAVFGIFGIVHKIPVHCRFVGATDNLRNAVRYVFEKPSSKGLKKFMQGPHIQMLCYDPMPNSSEEDRKTMEEIWVKTYEPNINDDGEYPNYQFEWFYDDDGKERPVEKIYAPAPPSATHISVTS
jgi:hypothetical protein